MKSIYLILSLLLSAIVYTNAQHEVKKVLSETDSLPIAGANVLFNNSGTVTNEVGEFQITRKKIDSVTISCIGYESKKVAIDTQNTFYLSVKNIELAELKVYPLGYTATEILRLCMAKLKENGPQKKYNLEVFYRHYCSDNNKYGRLIEAAITLQDKKGVNKQVEHPKNKIGIKINQIRRSYDYTKNFDEHEVMSVYSPMELDIYSYPNPLKYVDPAFNFTIQDTLFLDGNILWKIGFEYDRVLPIKNKKSRVEVEGYLLINAMDYGVVRYSEILQNNITTEYQSEGFNRKTEVNYRFYNGHYYPSFLNEVGKSENIKLGNEKDTVSYKDHEYTVTTMVNNIILNPSENISGKIPTQEFLESFITDSLFWEEYLILKETPLENKILIDLKSYQVEENKGLNWKN